MNKNIDHLESHIVELLLELQQLEQRITGYPEVESRCNQDGSDEAREYLMQYQHDYIDPFSRNVENLHFAIVTYLDFLKLDDVKEVFKKNFVENFSLEEALSDFVYNDWDAQDYLKYLVNISRFLSVFHFYPYKSESSSVDATSIKIVERVLSNTGVVISNKALIPRSETQVYNAVKEVFEPIFPSCRNPNGKFIQAAKAYVPDILIPEIKVAIEYKYARSAEKLKATMEQVYADVAGYKGHPEYSQFYAVFYVTRDFWGQEKFKRVWEEQGFPSNWKGIYIVGK
ncbi:hypothetical protein [Vibrio fluvialis]|uniref:PD-(D/E)XK nuclease domain-containing protein n=1 Tax=Vibrio fluvialis TaxID=676 RepID=UPI0014042ADB|nr:hypothetical protein [Vibrio fluvialis]EHH1242310.1 hypothetical protein [Vibrio parahaemolyticus]EKO3979435.1 hypothetical protein [Vibrio fluvialis]MBY8243129.1 hypothetical protein [Vibrio fluvialis]MDG2804829.1 hypothetical protein [Vibrio parahaemolyticus]MDG3027250.1 hypothetical protein [Vibrio parahaemolyticus]